MSTTVRKWLDVWVPYPGEHDKGIDGFIEFQRSVSVGKSKKRTATGHLILVQVKTGDGYLANVKSDPDVVRLNLGTEYIGQHRQLWMSHPEPTILVFVIQGSGKRRTKAWWTNLKHPDSYSLTKKWVVRLPKTQTFGTHSKGALRKLAGSFVENARLPTVNCSNDDAKVLTLKLSPKESAKGFYKSWAVSATTSRTNPRLGEVRVSRVGWRHITRKARSQERILQSFLLLPAAKRIITDVSEGGIGGLGHVRERQLQSGIIELRDYVGLRARVTFPHRGPAIVQVVLRRKRFIDPTVPGSITRAIWFHSVYELGRRR